MHPLSSRLAVLGSLALATLLPATAADPRSDTIQRTFEVAPGGTLILEADRGSLTLEGGATDTMEVVVDRRVTRGRDDQAADLLRRHQVTFSQDGAIVRVESDLEGESTWRWRAPQLEIDIRVRLPREFNVEARTAGGSVTASNLRGQLDLRTSGGSLRLESLGGTVKARTSGGSIRADALDGNVNLHTSGGSIHVEGATGERLQVTTSGGSIHLDRVTVPADAKTSGGSITIRESRAPLTANTSGGAINASLDTAPAADVSLRSSAGSITLTLPPTSAFDLDASTSAGSVHSEFPVSITDSGNRDSLRGPVNGGGPRIHLRTSAGGVRIRKG